MADRKTAIGDNTKAYRHSTSSKLLSCLRWRMERRSFERSCPLTHRHESDVECGKAAAAGASFLGVSLPVNAMLTPRLQSLQTSCSLCTSGASSLPSVTATHSGKLCQALLVVSLAISSCTANHETGRSAIASERVKLDISEGIRPTYCSSQRSPVAELCSARHWR